MKNKLPSEKLYKSFQKPTIEHAFYLLAFILIVFLTYEKNNLANSTLAPIYILCLGFSWLLIADGYLIISHKHKPNIFFFLSVLIFTFLCLSSIYINGLTGLVISFTGFAIALVYIAFTYIREIASK